MPRINKRAQQEPKREQKSPEQIKKEYKQIAEVKRQRALIKDKVYPFLLAHTKSIKEANVFLQVCKMAVQQAFANQKNTQTIDELKVIDRVDSKAQNSADYKEFLDLFRYEKLITAEQLIEGIGTAFDAFVSKELSQRPLSSLATDFLDPDDKSNPTP
jgi:hypothetical protein